MSMLYPLPRVILIVGLVGLALAAPLLAGCGEDEGIQIDPALGDPNRLTAMEEQSVKRFDAQIAAHCVRVSRGLLNPDYGPTPAQTRAAFGAARQLLKLASEKPGAPLGAGQDLRLFVSDVIENLEGSNCDPRMIALLSEGLARIPQT